MRCDAPFKPKPVLVTGKLVCAVKVMGEAAVAHTIALLTKETVIENDSVK